MNKNTTLILLAVVILAVIGFAAYETLFAPKPPVAPAAPSSAIPEGAHVITLTKDGFKPSELTIQKGETVAFVTDAGKMFWPASNLHPSHALYPEFDPKGPIQPDEVWSFTFDKPGAHPFHDHLAPYYTGTITVTE